jgi:hypothetical protein
MIRRGTGSFLQIKLHIHYKITYSIANLFFFHHTIPLSTLRFLDTVLAGLLILLNDFSLATGAEKNIRRPLNIEKILYFATIYICLIDFVLPSMLM